MKSFDVRVDLPDTGLGTVHTMSTVHLPEAVASLARVIFAYPGAGYSRQYFDITAKPGYSQAGFHTDRGDVVVACDHLFVGGSAVPDPFDSTYENVAAANHESSRVLLQQLRSGVLETVDGPRSIDAFEVSAVIGIGQSMGGCLLTVQQAVHQSFDAVALLGWSGLHTNFPASDGGRITFDVPSRGTDLRPLAEQLVELGGSVVGHYEFCFHWPQQDVDLTRADMIAYDPASGSVRGDPSCPWGSATSPMCGFTMVEPGTVAAEAAAISVPVLSACGVRDVVPDPWAEASAYRGSSQVTVAVFAEMAHMHNFADTRTQLWEFIDGWAGLIRPS